MLDPETRFSTNPSNVEIALYLLLAAQCLMYSLLHTDKALIVSWFGIEIKVATLQFGIIFKGLFTLMKFWGLDKEIGFWYIEPLIYKLKLADYVLWEVQLAVLVDWDTIGGNLTIHNLKWVHVQITIQGYELSCNFLI